MHSISQHVASHYATLLLTVTVALAVMLTGCESGLTGPASSTDQVNTSPDARRADVKESNLSTVSPVNDTLRDLMTQVNAHLAEQQAPFRIDYAEWIAGPGSGEIGRTVFFGDRGNKQLAAHFVPEDPRRSWSPPGEITYLVDQSDGSTSDGLTNAETEAAIDRAMATWIAVGCSALNLPKATDPDADPDLTDFILGFGPPPGPGFPYADVVHGGWIPLAPSVLGVTFTLVWIGPDGAPTDLDENGKEDVAFREIYYNNAYAWGIDRNIDVETTALHEMGHGLSQAHFGGLFRTNKNGKFHFNPRAVMNAGYTGVQQKLRGTDTGGHCSLWGQWPQN